MLSLWSSQQLPPPLLISSDRRNDAAQEAFTMKKSPKKLSLSIETLRHLDSRALLQAAGGLPHTETCNCPTFSCQSRPETECFCA
jgi:hypothetical protein